MDGIKVGAMIIGLCILGSAIGLPLRGIATIGMVIGAGAIFVGMLELWRKSHEAEERKKADFRRLFANKNEHNN